MKFLYICLAGVLGGVLAGMGMGGGTLTLPLLVLVFGVEQIVAQYANLLAFLPSGAVALALHIKNGLVDAKKLFWLLIPSLATSICASFFATKLDMQLLKRLFGIFLIVIAAASLLGKVCKKNREWVFTIR